MLEAMDGRKQAHMDVLVAVFGQLPAKWFRLPNLAAMKHNSPEA